MNNMTFGLDSTDFPGMLKIMDEFGNSETMYGGENTDHEQVLVSVAQDSIAVTTFQLNGWTRKNVYWRDGTIEELFDGRWK